MTGKLSPAEIAAKDGREKWSDPQWVGLRMSAANIVKSWYRIRGGQAERDLWMTKAIYWATMRERGNTDKLWAAIDAAGVRSSVEPFLEKDNARDV